MTKTTKAPVTDTRFVIGATELQAADTYFRAGQTKGQAFTAFYNAAFAPHDIDLPLVRAPMAERKAGNGIGQAMFSFTQSLYYIQRVGAEWAAKILDKNTSGDTMLEFTGVVSASGNPIKPQTKRAYMQSAGGKDWKAFLDMLEAAKTGADLDKVKRAGSIRKSDLEFVQAHMGDVVKRLAVDAEKLDGTIPFDIAPKLAKAVLDTFAQFGIK